MVEDVKLEGRILCLTRDSGLLRAQLDGKSILSPGEPFPELHYGVNTDAMISGAACTLGYTPEILGPYFLENFLECVQKDEIAQGGFSVLVAGDAYGSGSSREVAVVAHQGAGIQLVLARSFQRIFQENMVYAGMPFSTDFSLIDRLHSEQGLDLDALSEQLARELPPLFAAISQSKGLLAYGKALQSGAARSPLPTPQPSQGMTCVEKICAQKAWIDARSPLGLPSVQPGDQLLCKTDFRGMHEYTAGMVMALYRQAFGDAPVLESERAAAFEDHFVLLDQPQVPGLVKAQRLAPASRLRDEMIAACQQAQIQVHGPGQKDSGVCHRIVVERYAEPGEIVVLTDSHSPTAGVLNCLAFGVGSTAMAFALRTGLIPLTVPSTVRVWVEGEAQPALSPKDLILHLIGDPYFREEQWRQSPTDTCVIQFGGPGLDHWNVDELSVLTNMTVEGGLMTGIVEPGPSLRSFLQTHRPAAEAPAFVAPDPGAQYIRTIRIDLAEIPLTVATPGDSRNRIGLKEVVGTPVHNVVIASCTGGSLADLRAAAQVLRGRSLAPGMRLTVTPASSLVAERAREEGLLELFESLGGVVTDPGCGSCIGNGPGIPRDQETTASTTNRNFDRRMGAPGPVYLVSPALAAAAAVRGALCDPRKL